MPVGVTSPLRPDRAEAPRPWTRALVLGLACLVFIELPAAAATHHPGSVLPYVLFQASFTVMLLSALPRPRSYAYAFLAAFLFLGFWAKFNLHTLLEYPYQEPIGAFGNSGESWDRALLFASCGALGVTLARILQLGWVRRRRHAEAAEEASQATAPAWFVDHRKAVWLATAAVCVAVNLANLIFAFYEVGVEPRLVLPAHMNVAAAWMVKLGTALWIAVLVYWEGGLDRPRSRLLPAAPVGEATIASVSALSRGIFLFHVLPYFLVIAGRWRHYRRAVGPARLAAMAAIAAAAFVLSLTAVSGLRLLLYPAAPSTGASLYGSSAAALRPVAPADTKADSRAVEREVRRLRVQARRVAERPEDGQAASQPEPLPDAGASENDPFRAERLSFAVREVLGLAIERWNGMEGVMAVSAHDGLGGDLLADAVREDPSRGQDSLYQRISRADRVYDNTGGYTFLTLPGAVGVLAYSGSYALVLAGMAFLTGVALTLDRLVRRLTRNPYLAAVSGLAVAVELSQANFPYLLGAFFVLLALSLGLLSLLANTALGRALPPLRRWVRRPGAGDG